MLSLDKDAMAGEEEDEKDCSSDSGKTNPRGKECEESRK